MESTVTASLFKQYTERRKAHLVHKEHLPSLTTIKKMIDRFLACALGKAKRKLAKKKVGKKKVGLKKARIVVEAKRLHEEKEKRQKEEEEARLKFQSPWPKKGKTIPKRRDPPIAKAQERCQKCRHDTPSWKRKAQAPPPPTTQKKRRWKLGTAALREICKY